MCTKPTGGAARCAARADLRIVRVGRIAVRAITEGPLADAIRRRHPGRCRCIVVAHVLDDDLAFGVLGAARVLGRPRDAKLRSHHVRHGRRRVVGIAAIPIAALGVVLRVHQPVVVVAISATLVEAVVGTRWVLHIHVRMARAHEEEERQRAHIALGECRSSLNKA